MTLPDREDCELCFGFNFRNLNSKADITPLSYSCTLLKKDRNYCLLLFVLIYLFFEDLLIFKCQRKNANKPIGGWVLDWKWPCWVYHKEAAVLFKPGDPDYLLYLFVKLCPQIKLCKDKTHVSDKHWVLVFLCLGQQELLIILSVVSRRFSVLEVEYWNKYPGRAPSRGWQDGWAQMALGELTSIITLVSVLPSPSTTLGSNCGSRVRLPPSSLARIHPPPAPFPHILVT